MIKSRDWDVRDVNYVYRDEELIKYLSSSTWSQVTAWTPKPKLQDNIKTVFLPLSYDCGWQSFSRVLPITLISLTSV
jgi:hypothetical protein